jgi:hypothetical protein
MFISNNKKHASNVMFISVKGNNINRKIQPPGSKPCRPPVVETRCIASLQRSLPTVPAISGTCGAVER